MSPVNSGTASSVQGSKYASPTKRYYLWSPSRATLYDPWQSSPYCRKGHAFDSFETLYTVANPNLRYVLKCDPSGAALMPASKSSSGISSNSTNFSWTVASAAGGEGMYIFMSGTFILYGYNTPEATLTKVDFYGNTLWTKSAPQSVFTGPSAMNASMAVSSSGDVYTAAGKGGGYFKISMTPIVVRWSSAGTIAFSASIDLGTGSEQSVKGISLNTSKNSITVIMGFGTTQLVSLNATTGVFLNTTTITTASSSITLTVTDSAGALYIIGADSTGNIVAKYTQNTNGSYSLAWKRTLTVTAIQSLDVDSAGNLYVLCADTTGYYIVKIQTSTGTSVWSRKLYGTYQTTTYVDTYDNSPRQIIVSPDNASITLLMPLINGQSAQARLRADGTGTGFFTSANNRYSASYSSVVVTSTDTTATHSSTTGTVPVSVSTSGFSAADTTPATRAGVLTYYVTEPATTDYRISASIIYN